MITGCIRRGSYLSICCRVEDVKIEQDHSILTSQSMLFLCWIQTRQHRRTYAQSFWAHFYCSRWQELKRVGYDYEQKEDMIEKLSLNVVLEKLNKFNHIKYFFDIHAYWVKGNDLNINHIP